MEKIDLGKFALSFADPLAWVKTLRFSLGTLGIILLCFTIYKAYFKPTNNSSQTIRVERGASVGMIGTPETKKSFEPFTEVYVQFDNKEEGRIGVRCGLKF
jgi:hypothetical protein